MAQANTNIRPNSLEQYENKRDELMVGLREAYEAGYKRALEDQQKGEEMPTTEQVAGSEYIGECHYYYWDGRTLPLDPWLREHFGVDQ